jgi:hypothetical protein
MIPEVILSSCLSPIGLNAADDSQERFLHMLFEDTDKSIIIYQIFRSMLNNGNYMIITSISHVMIMT